MLNNNHKDENIVLETEENDQALKKSMKQFRKTLFTIISIIIILVTISATILFIRINNAFSEPVFRVISASHNTFTAYSAKIDAVLENKYTNKKSIIKGQYKINPDAQKFDAVFDVNSKPLDNSSETEDKINVNINFTKNGGKILCTQNNETETIDISKESAKRFFIIFAQTKDSSITNLNIDWQKFVEETELQNYINADKVYDSLTAVYNALSSEDCKKDILGLTSESTESDDVVSFALNPYLTADYILENIKPIFKRDEDYNYYRKLLDENKSTLDSIVLRFDITISEGGFIKELSADNLGIKLDIKISDIEV